MENSAVFCWTRNRNNCNIFTKPTLLYISLIKRPSCLSIQSLHLHSGLWNHDNCEKNAGRTDAGDADEDRCEPELVLEKEEQLGHSEAQSPKGAMVETSYRLLKKEDLNLFQESSSATCSRGSNSSPRRVYLIGPKPNWKEPTKRTRVKTTRMLFDKSSSKFSLPKIQLSVCEVTQKIPEKMVAPIPMPVAHSTRKTFLEKVP